MKRLLIPAIAFLLCCCHDKDPGPDLTSGSISFNWNTPGLITKYYVVISDTSGNVLQWSKLGQNINLEMPYPPGDSKLANVTIIGINDRQDGSARFTHINTYVGVRGDAYSFEFPMYQRLNTDAEVVARIEGIGTSSVSIYLSGECEVKDVTSGATFQEEVFGVFTGKKNDLLMSVNRTYSPVTTQQYVYYPDVVPGTFVATPDDFAEAPFFPEHPVTYPEQSTLKYSLGFIRGNTNGSYSLFAGSFEPDETPSFNYPDIPGLFDEYETTMIGYGKNGDAYVTHVLATTPITNFSHMGVSATQINETTTKRISVDLDGTTDGIRIGRNFGDRAGNEVSWDVYAPANSPAIRVNPPTFPDDLLEEIIDLKMTQDRSFDYMYVTNYQQTHDEVCRFFLTGNFRKTLPFSQIKAYVLNADNNGRQSDDAGITRLLKQLGLESPRK